MPPMGDMDANDPMANPAPMDSDVMGGDIPPADDGMGAMPDGGEGIPAEGDNQEIDDIYSQLSTEDQASVLKYAKSMVKDNGSEEGGMPDMQAETKKHIRSIVTEVVNSILGSEENGGVRPDNRIRNKRAKGNSPFVTKY